MVVVAPAQSVAGNSGGGGNCGVYTTRMLAAHSGCLAQRARKADFFYTGAVYSKIAVSSFYMQALTGWTCRGAPSEIWSVGSGSQPTRLRQVDLQFAAVEWLPSLPPGVTADMGPLAASAAAASAAAIGGGGGGSTADTAAAVYCSGCNPWQASPRAAEAAAGGCVCTASLPVHACLHAVHESLPHEPHFCAAVLLY